MFYEGSVLYCILLQYELRVACCLNTLGRVWPVQRSGFRTRNLTCRRRLPNCISASSLRLRCSRDFKSNCTELVDFVVPPHKSHPLRLGRFKFRTNPALEAEEVLGRSKPTLDLGILVDDARKRIT